MTMLPSTELAVVLLSFFILALVYGKRYNWRNEKNISLPGSPQPHKETRKTFSRDRKPSIKSQLEKDKQLYYKLQNLHQYPDCLEEARQRLVQLLDISLYEAKASQDFTILSVREFSSQALLEFLHQSTLITTDAFEKYRTRRSSGGHREMFPNKDYAKYWLRIAAPVKYVDGSWLGGLHRLKTTRLKDRQASKIAWQILSEELGDGDLAKNHVWVYEQLIRSISMKSIGYGDEEKFISNVSNPNTETTVWRAAVAQLCMSLFPDQFFPEILGFNMSYESLPLHLLITLQELKELDIDAYYFVLHVSIDNSDSGHAAMGAAAVIEYMESLSTQEEKQQAWRRVQAGYILAEGIPTIPRPISELDRQVERIFEKKCEAARPMHVFCPAKVGGNVFGKPLSEWLNAETYRDNSFTFLRALEESKWIVRGNPIQSRFIKELEWGGRMFGAYTSGEVKVIEAWIENMKDPLCELEATGVSNGTYKSYTQNDPFSFYIAAEKAFQCPLNWFFSNRPFKEYYYPRTLAELLLLPATANVPSSTTQKYLTDGTTQQLATLLAWSATPFEHFPSYPSKISCSKGMAALITLRALYGFLPESNFCAGMDEVVRPKDDAIGVVELGIRLGGTIDIDSPLNSATLSDFLRYLSSLSRAPDVNMARLVGIQLGFAQCLMRNKTVWKYLGLTEKDRSRLNEIAKRCIAAWIYHIVEDGELEWNDIVEGFILVMEQVLAAQDILCFGGGRRKDEFNNISSSDIDKLVKDNMFELGFGIKATDNIMALGEYIGEFGMTEIMKQKY